MSAPEKDVLLDKLQQTIHLWSDEVTEAHSSLTQQISDTRTQLATLIDAIDKRGESPDDNARYMQNGDSPSGRELERTQTALNETVAHNKLLLQDLDAIKSDYAALNEKHRHTITLNQKLATSLKALKNRENRTAADRDAAQHKLEEISAAQSIQDSDLKRLHGEMEQLVKTANEAVALQDELLRERDALEEENANLRAQAHEATELKAQLEAQHSQIAQLQTEISLHKRHLEDNEPQRQALCAERDELADKLAKAKVQVQHLEEHAQLAAAQRIQIMTAELTEKDAALTKMREQLDELSATVQPANDMESELRSENLKLMSQLSIFKQNELDLKSELASLGQEYERQAEVLRDAVKEVEAHWNIESEARDREQRLKIEIDSLNVQLKEKHNQILQLEQETSELPPAEIPTEPIAPTTASGRTERDLEEYNLDLITLENFLKEREKNIELATDKMKSLEATAHAVQAEVNALREEHQRRMNQPDDLTAQALQSAEEEIFVLKKSLDQQTRIADAQQDVIDEQNRAMDAYKEELDRLKSEIPAADSQGDQLEEALHQIESLKNSLRQRDVELEKLKTTTADPAIAFAAFDDDGKQRSMGQILVEADIINEQQLTSALEEQESAGQRRLGSILVEKGHIREEIVAQVVASQLKLPFIRLEETIVAPEALTLFDARIAAQHMAFPVESTETEATIAMANPLDLIAIEDLEFATHKTVKPVVATHADIAQAIVAHYGVAIPSNAAGAPSPKSREASPSDNQ